MVLLVMIAGFVAFELAYPRFPDVDDMFFKAPGRNLSIGGGFAAPEFEGFLKVEPPIERIYFPHPPVYPWLFGQFCSLAGFSWRVCVACDALISAGLALTLWGLARRFCDAALGATQASGLIAAGVALLTLLLRQPARPDELAMLWSYANVLLLLGRLPNRATAPLSGALAGLTLCTSVGVFIAFVPVLAGFWILRTNRAQIISSLALFAAGSLAAVATALTPLYLEDPLFYRQFLAHSAAMASQPPLSRVVGAIRLAAQVAPPRLLLAIGTIPLLLVGTAMVWRRGARLEAVAWYGAPIVGLMLLLLLRPAHTYWWFLQPWFAITAGAVVAELCARRIFAGAAAGMWMLSASFAALMWPAKDFIVRTSLRPEQQFRPAVDQLRGVIPANATVLTTAGWAALADDHRIIDAQFSDVADLSRIDFFVADGYGTGAPGSWREPANERYKQLIREEFEIVADNLPRDRVTFLGRSISRSAYGWGMLVMRRRDLVSSAGPSEPVR